MWQACDTWSKTFYDNGRNMCWDMQFWIKSLDKETDSFTCKSPYAGKFSQWNIFLLQNKKYSYVAWLRMSNFYCPVRLAIKTDLPDNLSLCAAANTENTQLSYIPSKGQSCILYSNMAFFENDIICNDMPTSTVIKYGSTWATDKRDVNSTWKLNYNARFPARHVKVDGDAAEVSYHA